MCNCLYSIALSAHSIARRFCGRPKRLAPAELTVMCNCILPYSMKNTISYAIVLFLLFSSNPIMACCYTYDLYFVTNVKPTDALNVRQEPHPLSPVVETLSYDQRYFLLKNYGDINEEMHRHNLCVTVSYSPLKGNRSISKWCQLREPKGWINMYYLSSCEVETNDSGTIISTKCSDVIKGKKLSDYLF